MHGPYDGILGDWNATSDDIRQVMERAIRNALIGYRDAGVFAATMRDGHVVLIEADELLRTNRANGQGQNSSSAAS